MLGHRRARAGAGFVYIDAHGRRIRDPGTLLLAARALRACAPCAAGSARTRNVKQCIEQVAAALRNTPAVCRRSYVHPAILDAYMSGVLERVRARSDEGVVLAVLRTR